MRFAGSLTLAIVLAASCGGLASAQAPRALKSHLVAPNLAPPDSAEGAWIADDQPAEPVAPARPIRRVPLAMGQRVAYAPEMVPTPAPEASMQPIPTGMAQQYGDGYGDSYGDGDGMEDGGGDDCLFGGSNPRWWSFGNLWCDTHSHYRIYARAEAAMMYAKGNRLPALLTGAPEGVIPAQDVAGRLPAAPVLFGNQSVDTEAREGGRITAGVWLADGEYLGLEGHYFGLRPASTNYFNEGVFSDGGTGPLLARPFFNTDPNVAAQDAVLLAYPQYVHPNGNLGTGDLNGNITIHTFSDIQSAGALLRNMLWIDYTSNYRVDTLAGYRFFRLKENLDINDQTLFLGNDPVTINSYDSFVANNAFHGGEFGLDWQIFRGRWSLEVLTKVALGNNRQTVNIQGSTVARNNQGVAPTTVGGFLAEPSNIGKSDVNMFTVIPELGINARLELTHNIRFTVGYNFLWVSNVVRSGDQINLNIDGRQIQNPSFIATDPVRRVNESTFYLQGLTGGVECRF